MASDLPAETAVSDANFKNFVQNLNLFESRFGKSLYSKTENSVVCVPSAQILLGFLYTGARGKTASELATLFGNRQEATLINFRKFISTLEVPEIKMATAACVAEDIALRREFLALGEKYFNFNISVNRVDFKNKEESVKTINDLVEQKTESLIKELIKAADIDDDAKLILLNAIYLKQEWQYQFKPDDTADGPFKVSKTKEIRVKLMSQTRTFAYAEDDDYQYLEMPYKDGKLSMLIILPKNIETFETKDITNTSFWQPKFGSYEVKVSMPKFKVESSVDWGSILQAKAPSAFNQSANLSGISDTPLMVSKMIQRVYIKVDEAGTEAAAATGIASRRIRGADPVERKEFIIDRPFYFKIYRYISHDEKFVLFSGSIREPSFPESA